MRITVFKRSEKGSLYQKAVPAIAKINASRSKDNIFVIDFIMSFRNGLLACGYDVIERICSDDREHQKHKGNNKISFCCSPHLSGLCLRIAPIMPYQVSPPDRGHYGILRLVLFALWFLFRGGVNIVIDNIYASCEKRISKFDLVLDDIRQ